TFFAIDEMAALVSPFCAVRCVEILDARPATGNRLVQYRLDRGIERVYRRPAQATHLKGRMQPGAKDNFVRVNIPNPCDHLLMHQERLEASSPRLQETDELVA